MSSKSEIARMGIVNILNDMKNPLTNIKLCMEMIESDHHENEGKNCNDIIKKNTEKLEASIRDLVKSFEYLGISVHLAEDKTPVNR